MGTSSDVGSWNKVSHPQSWRSWGSHPCSSENTTMKTLLTPNESPWKRKYRIWNKANSSKEKAKMVLFRYDYVPELNTKNLGNSPSFLFIAHTTLWSGRAVLTGAVA
jgi:hypothetical protein